MVSVCAMCVRIGEGGVQVGVNRLSGVYSAPSLDVAYCLA